MREIKFRAINEITGEWEYGNLLRSEIAANGSYFINIARPFAFDPNVRQIACKKGTEGQFTGLQDKNGVDIYEGDVLEYWTLFPDGYPLDKTRQRHIKVIELKNICNGCFLFAHHVYEVIGNIYQNPELIQK